MAFQIDINSLKSKDYVRNSSSLASGATTDSTFFSESELHNFSIRSLLFSGTGDGIAKFYRTIDGVTTLFHTLHIDDIHQHREVVYTNRLRVEEGGTISVSVTNTSAASANYTVEVLGIQETEASLG